jgi:hypothetical protein
MPGDMHKVLCSLTRLAGLQTTRCSIRLSVGAILRQTFGIDPHISEIGIPFQQCQLGQRRLVIWLVQSCQILDASPVWAGTRRQSRAEPPTAPLVPGCGSRGVRELRSLYEALTPSEKSRNNFTQCDRQKPFCSEDAVLATHLLSYDKQRSTLLMSFGEYQRVPANTNEFLQ